MSLRSASGFARRFVSRWDRLLTLTIAVVALVVSFAAAVFSYRQAQDQEAQAQLVTLRAQYPRMTELLDKVNRSGLETAELETETNNAAATLRTLGDRVTSDDLFFVADIYRRNNHSDAAIPLYQAAFRRAAGPDQAISALRGLAFSEAVLGSRAAAESDMARALQVSRAGYSDGTRDKYDANTERIWVIIENTFHDCTGVRVHADRYLVIQQRVPSDLHEGGDNLSLVKGFRKECRGKP